MKSLYQMEATVKLRLASVTKLGTCSIGSFVCVCVQCKWNENDQTNRWTIMMIGSISPLAFSMVISIVFGIFMYIYMVAPYMQLSSLNLDRPEIEWPFQWANIWTRVRCHRVPNHCVAKCVSFSRSTANSSSLDGLDNSRHQSISFSFPIDAFCLPFGGLSLSCIQLVVIFFSFPLSLFLLHSHPVTHLIESVSHSHLLIILNRAVDLTKPLANHTNVHIFAISGHLILHLLASTRHLYDLSLRLIVFWASTLSLNTNEHTQSRLEWCLINWSKCALPLFLVTSLYFDKQGSLVALTRAWELSMDRVDSGKTSSCFQQHARTQTMKINHNW